MGASIKKYKKGFMTLQKLIEMLEDEYFCQLEEEGIDYHEYDREEFWGFPCDRQTIKQEFVLSNDEMAVELGYKNFVEYITEKLEDEGITTPSWVKEWTQNMLVDTNTEYGTVKISENESEII